MSRHDVAIVGIGCRFPRTVCGPEQFWEFLRAGGDAVGPIPEDRWSWRAFYDPDPAKPGKMHVARGAFLEQRIEVLDARFFGIAPREAAQVDPQQRLLLEVSWEALEDAGADIWSLAGSSTGVYIGAFMLDNLIEQTEPNARVAIGPQTAMTCTNTVLASRLSYVYDLRGPSMTIDTACSSSLVAVNEAVRSLLDGGCDRALAGGVSRIFRPEPALMMSKGQFLAADGRSKAFSAQADGYGRGEGCGIVVLKRLADALASSDRIYAVIEGSGVNQDGRTIGPAVPSAEAQEALVRAVVARAGVDPATVGFVEAHGTGTPVGDPIEMQALGAAFGQAPGRDAPCLVGSVKAGIGHLEGAAGVAGLIKAALVAQRGTVPPQAWLDEPNPEIDFASLGLEVAATTSRIPASLGLRRVAVNSFGYGGTNAHVILREPPADPGLPPMPATAADLILPVALVSGHDEAAVADLAGAYVATLDDAGAADDGARDRLLSAWAARTAHEHRRVVLGDPAAFTERLAELADGKPHPDVVAGRARQRERQPAFVFSGMGPQWWGMGRDLLRASASFRAHVDRCDEIFVPLAGWAIGDELRASQHRSRITSTAVAQPCSFVLQSGIAAILTEMGVRPAAAIGHSVGELAAAYVAGCLDLEEALVVVHHRGRLLATTAGRGGMLATGLDEGQARELTARHGGAVSIAAVNSATATTLSGDTGVLEAIADELTDRGVFHRALTVEVPYHSPALDPVLPELAVHLAGVRAAPPALPLYTTVDGQDDQADRDADYWVANTRAPVVFAPAIQRMLADGHRTFLEIGAHPVLSMYIHQIAGATPGTSVVTTLHRNRPGRRSMTEALAQLWAQGVPVDWRPALGAPSRAVTLPLYPWQREEHWQESSVVRQMRTRAAGPGSPLAGQLVGSAPPTREVELSPTTLPWCRDHRVAGTALFPLTGYIEAVAAHARATTPEGEPVVIEDVAIERPLVLDDHEDPMLRLVELPGGQIDLLSRVRQDSGSWRAHGRARVAPGRHLPPSERAPLGGTGKVLLADDVYRALTDLGFDYRGDFVAARRVDRHVDRARAEIEVRTDAAELAGYVAYPPLLDAALHATLAAFADGTPIVPVSVERVVLHRSLPTSVSVDARVTRSGRGVAVDLVLFDQHEVCLAELAGIELRPLARVDETQAWLDRRCYEERWAPADDLVAPDAADPAGRSWLVISADRDFVTDVVPRGAAARSAVDLAAVGDADLREAAITVVDLRDAHDVGQAIRDADAVVSLVQRLAAIEPPTSVPPEVVLVTRDAVDATPTDTGCGWLASWVSGLRRAAANETPHVRLRHVDLAGGAGTARIAAALTSPLEELAIREGQLHAPQLTPLTSADEPAGWWSATMVRPGAEAETFGLVAPTPNLDSLRWAEARRRAPERGEIELRIEAVGLNYKDVLRQRGALAPEMTARSFTGAHLGMEASVVVERVGSGVEGIEVGRRYAATLRSGCFASHVTIDAHDARLLPAPEAWTSVETAGMLVAFGTAHRVIAELAQLQPGETLLIHGATGGFGLAALQVAAACGARVLATAGTPEKRALLRGLGVERVYDSRSRNFVDEAVRDTGGRGVDVVVNTLTVDGLRTNLRAVADGGRVVDIGKREIAQRGALPLELFDRNLTFASFDLDHLAQDQHAFQALGERVLANVAAGVYTPLPTTTYPAAEVRMAFATLGRAEHTGKVVVDLDDRTDLVCHVPQRPPVAIRGDRLYVVSGGTGAVGQLATAWLAAAGARHIALLSRRGVLDAAGQALVDRLTEEGVDVQVAAVDVTSAEAVRTLVERERAAGRAVGGVVHAAGVSHDVPLHKVSGDDLAVVLGPKLRGAVNLHEATHDHPVDFFILTSSVSALTGTSGQAAYAAANTALDGFARWRRRQGRPATAIDLGPIAEVGMAATDEQIERYLELLGFTALPPERFAAILDRSLRWDRPVLGVFDLDWRAWAHAEPRAFATPRFGAVQHLATEVRNDANELRARLRALPEAQRAEIVTRHVQQALALALGTPDGDIEVETPLGSLGLDSLMHLEAQTYLNEVLGTDLTIMGLAGMDTVTEIAQHLSDAIATSP